MFAKPLDALVPLLDQREKNPVVLFVEALDPFSTIGAV